MNGGQNRVVVKHLDYNDKDVGSNPITGRNEKKTDIGGTPLQKVAQGSKQDLSGQPAIIKLN